MAFSHRNIIIAISLAVLIGTGYGAFSKSDPSRKQATPSVKDSRFAKARTELVKRENGRLTVEFECPPFTIERDSLTRRITGLDIAGATPCYETGVPRLPVISQLLDCLPGRVSVTITDIESENITLGDMAAMPPDMPVDVRPSDDGSHDETQSLDDGSMLTWQELSAMTPLKQGLWPPEPVTVQDAGVFRGHRLVSLRFHPVQVDAARGLARIIRRVRVQVTVPQDETAADRLPDRDSETQLVRSLLGPLAQTALPTRMPEAFTGNRGGDRTLDDGIGGRWKIVVKEEGIVHLTGAQLRLAGCPIDQISTYDTHIKNRGREIPIYFSGETDGHFDDDDFIEFWGEPNRLTQTSFSPALYTDPWSDKNVYWLSWGNGRNGLRLGEEDGAHHPNWPAKTVTYVRNTVHFERDSKFDRLSQSSLDWGSAVQTLGPLATYEDHWFWDERIDALTTRSYNCFLTYPATQSLGGVVVRAALQGLTARSIVQGSGNHRAIVRLNGQTAPGLSVGRITPSDGNTPWIGQTAVIIQNVLPDSGIPHLVTGDLLVGNNVVSVFMPGDGPAGTVDKIYANWFEIDYERTLRASSTEPIQFRFDTTRGDTFSFEVRGFGSRNFSVWKLGHSRLTNLSARIIRPADESASWGARFQLISDDAYDIVAFDARHFRPPVEIVPEQSVRNLRTMAGAEYLLIYHDSFADDLWLARLDSLRRASFHGLADSFRVSEIYDQFNYGIASPDAIREFIKYAYENWPIRPTNVCLVGDGMLYYRYGNLPGNLISSLYPATFDFGIAASDMFFGTVSGPPWDIIPDVAVGRISCRSKSELQTYVEKVLRYEDPQQSAYNTLFHATALFVSDGWDGRFRFDTWFSEPTVRLLPDAVNVTRVYIDSLPRGTAPLALRDAMRRGAAVVNYNGHGGGGVWSGTEIMDVSSVRLLNNRRAYPFIANFTCYVGAFDDRDQAAVLGEAFLFERNSRGDPVGAIGVYSSSGVGWAFAGIGMQSHLFDHIFSPPGMTQGEAVALNKAKFWGSRTYPGITIDNIYSQTVMMCLLGDPGVRLQIPQQTWTTFAPDTNVVSIGDSIFVSGSLPWEPAGVADVYLLPFNGDRYDYSSGRWIWNPAIQESVWLVTPTFQTSKIPAFNIDEVIPFPVTTRLFENLPLRMEGFTTPTGNLVVYAVDPGRPPSGNDPGVPPRDAIGAHPIFLADSLSALRISNVEVLPYGRILSDSTYRVRARIAHRDGIEQVRYRGILRPPQGPVILDTVMMTPVVSGLWETPLLGPRRVLGAAYRAEFYVKPFGGEFTSGTSFDLPLETTTDFTVQSSGGIAPQLRPGSHPYYNIPVAHWRVSGAREFPSLDVQLIAVGRDTARIPRPPLPDSLVITVDSFSTTGSVANPWDLASIFEVQVPAPLRPMSYVLTVKLDPANLIPESYENNNIYTATLPNVRLLPVTNARGTYVPRSDEENAAHVFRIPGVADTLWLRLAPGSLTVDSSTLIYLGPTLIGTADLRLIAGSGMLPAYPGGPNYRYRVMLADSTERLVPGTRVEVGATLQAKVVASNVPQALSRLHIFHRFNESAFWAKASETALTVFKVDTTYVVRQVPGTPSFVIDTTFLISGRVSGIVPGLGHVGVFQFVDNRGPTIELAVNGLKFTPHSLLPRQPAIYATLSDPSGVDRSPGKFYFILDGDTIPEAAITWSDSLSSTGSISALIRPELEPGHHVIRVRATDNVGIADSVMADFEVRGTFGFEWAMNYPNPFKRSTTIGYVLTDASDQFVEVKIFTVSGRHIRTLRETQRIVANYREITWDGLDDRLEEVANGIYFAKLIARKGEQKVETIVKMAKAR